MGLIIAVTLILLVSIVYFLMVNGKLPNSLGKKTESLPLGEQIYTQAKNPLEEKLPETNPFNVETNPAKKAYPNPFN